MIGCDIVKVSRFERNLSKLAFNILTAPELVEFTESMNKIQYLAGRWAAKEAIFKATGHKRMTVLNKSNGAPYVLDNPNIQISISHEKEYAIAFVLIL
jgi:holo-[acyl-carrier protein] synthase